MSRQDFVLEGLFLMILFGVVGVFFWLGREIWLLKSQPPAPEGPTELIIPSASLPGAGGAEAGCAFAKRKNVFWVPLFRHNP